MKVIQGRGKVELAVVCCLHGDEVFGEQIFRHYQELLGSKSGLRLILANEEAFRKGVRYIDDDLNRSFPGSTSGNHEAKLATEMMPIIKDARFVLDIHTTTSDIEMTPIVCSLNRDVKKALNLTTSKEIAKMGKQIANHALIGQVNAGISLEFNEEYAKTGKALTEMVNVIEGLLGGKQNQPIQRRVFQISGTIPLTDNLPEETQNFSKVASLGIYPFLLHERAYNKAHQGFAAPSYTSVEI